VQRWSHLLAPGESVLDVACGGGRHLAWFSGRGHTVCGVDIDTSIAAVNAPQAELIQADIENGPWPLAQRQFGGVVVCNYLWRPLFPRLLESLAYGGLLIYETFASGQELLGRPRRPDFLLQPNELLQVCRDLHVVAYECGLADAPTRAVQRIVAVRGDASGGATRALSLK
jgi:SAM-dependent methyltransferase